MTIPHRRSDIFYNNDIQVFKCPRRLVESGLLMELSVYALRLYMICCYSMYRNRRDVYRIKLEDLSTLGLSGQQACDAANEIQASELLKVSLHNDPRGRNIKH